jgi:pimeloyl-ACP methyl ester carboxylesterase
VNVRVWLAGNAEPEARALVAEMQRKLLRAPGRDDDVRMATARPAASTRLAEVSVPTLVVTGDEDVRDIHEIADKLAAEIPRRRERAGSRGSGHLPSLERPESSTASS